jgi:hypothetical protein
VPNHVWTNPFYSGYSLDWNESGTGGSNMMMLSMAYVSKQGRIVHLVHLVQTSSS